MASTLPADQVQLLLSHPRGEGMVVSCYADTSVQEGFEPRWSPHLKSEATRVRELLAADPEAREQFEVHLASIRRVLESSAARHARGMAVFGAPGWEEPLALPSPEPYDNRLVVAQEPYLVPLFVADDRGREYLVVSTDAHHGRLEAASLGESRRLDELDAPVPQKQHTAGDRHRKEAIHHFQKELAGRVERAWAEGEYQGIILLGEHEVLEGFRRHLPRRLADRVVHEAPLSPSDAGPGSGGDVRAVVARAIVAQDDRLLDAVQGRLHEGYGVITGPQEVIAALRDGQVGELILGPDAGESGARCTGCRAVFAAEELTCPFCKAPCETVNLWQAILTLAVGHHVAAHVVSPRAGRAVPNNIAALLLRDEPQWSTGTSGAGQDNHPGA